MVATPPVFSGRRLLRVPFVRWSALALCALVFLWHGPIRAADPSVNMDAPLLLMAAATWREGGNPYDVAEVGAVSGKNADSVAQYTLQRGPQAFVYSPPVYALLSPLTLLPLPFQRLTWNVLNTVWLMAAMGLICRLFNRSIRSTEGVTIFAVGLATNPSHICLALGQTGIVVLFLTSASWCIAPAKNEPEAWHRILAAALTAGIAAVVKPQIMLVYLALDLYVGRWRIAAGTAVFAALLFAVAVGVHGHSGVVLSGWIANMHALTHADADPLSIALPHQLINLQSPLATLLGSRTLSTALALGTCGLLSGIYVWIDRSDQAPPPRLHRWLNALSAFTILMLLIFYHRIYDAVFLLIPAAFALRLIGFGDPRGWALIATLAPLWIPLSSMIYVLLKLSGPFAVGTFTQAFFVQNQTWFLVAAFLLLCDTRRDHRATSSNAPHDAV